MKTDEKESAIVEAKADMACLMWLLNAAATESAEAIPPYVAKWFANMMERRIAAIREASR